MILAEEGKLSLLDALEKHLPEFRSQTIADGSTPKHPITIRELRIPPACPAALPRTQRPAR
jgi:CubicO group peptidase (beta-lactamase class C family)